MTGSDGSPSCGALPWHKDKRTPGFIERYGIAYVEVAALPPAVLTQVLEDAIDDAIADPDAWDEEQDQQQYDLQALWPYARHDGHYVDTAARGGEI